MSSQDLRKNPRVIIIQKLYSKDLNADTEIEFPKHRFKKFIKDVVLGSLERKELIEKTIVSHLKEDIDIKRTEKLVMILLHAAIFELLYKPETSVNIIINESLKKASINSTKTLESSFSFPLKEARENFEKSYLTSQLKKFKGNISKTADFVGMERSALHRKLKTLGIKGIN